MWSSRHGPRDQRIHAGARAQRAEHVVPLRDARIAEGAEHGGRRGLRQQRGLHRQRHVARQRARGGFGGVVVNQRGQRVDQAVERGVLDRFDGGVASCEVHINKPDPRIYQALLDKYGLKASECVFIDDNLANVQAAFTLGFVGIRMKESVGTLIRSLATCNVALR